jgi:hypothetical protein
MRESSAVGTDDLVNNLPITIAITRTLFTSHLDNQWTRHTLARVDGRHGRWKRWTGAKDAPHVGWSRGPSRARIRCVPPLPAPPRPPPRPSAKKAQPRPSFLTRLGTRGHPSAGTRPLTSPRPETPSQQTVTVPWWTRWAVSTSPTRKRARSST